jgi:hypothetical protein
MRPLKNVFSLIRIRVTTIDIEASFLYSPGLDNESLTKQSLHEPSVPLTRNGHMALPTFIVIGAVKAGTTSLYHYLAQHPDIQMSRLNWPRFFHFDGQVPDFDALAAKYGPTYRLESEERFKLMTPPKIPRNVGDYESLWEANPEEKARGEISPTYLYDPAVPACIRNRLPNAKLIVILRNPVARAYSHYVMDLRNGWEEINDFAQALEREPFEIDDFWWGKRHYIRHGFYVNPLQRFLREFDSEQIKVFLYDDYQASPHKMLRVLFRYLGVGPSFEVDMSMRYNKGLLPADTRVTRFLRLRHPVKHLLLSLFPKKLVLSFRQRIIEKQSLTGAPSMTREIEKRLIEIFRDDVLCLQDLVKRDLSTWLQHRGPVSQQE